MSEQCDVKQRKPRMKGDQIKAFYLWLQDGDRVNLKAPAIQKLYKEEANVDLSLNFIRNRIRMLKEKPTEQ